MSRLIDAHERALFEDNLEQNFSVIAPAGVGKTTAIVRRLKNLFSREPEWVHREAPSLIVVTYTNKSAMELQERTRLLISEDPKLRHVEEALSQVFFGTLHSLCVSVIRQYGHWAGVSTDFELISDEDNATLWDEFISSEGDGVLREIDERLLRLIRLQDVLDLAGKSLPANAGNASPSFPEYRFDPVYRFEAKGNGKANVLRFQKAFREWEERWSSGDPFLPLPVADKGGAAFIQTCREAVRPVMLWQSEMAARAALLLQKAFREYRHAKGHITYDEQVALTGELVRHPEVLRRIQSKHYRVILDEAQDTDPRQFDILMALSSDEGGCLRKGSFSMVGDPQQAIYDDRADLAYYRKMRDKLVADGGSEIRFSVTFRCSRSIVEYVNELGAELLNGQHHQASYVPLMPAEEARQGQVVRYVPEVSGESFTSCKEAADLARWIKQCGVQRLGVSSWSEVAILCPRNAWLSEIASSLRSEGLPCQQVSGTSMKGDHAFFRWVSALAAIIAEPSNSFEIVGVLREIYGVSDVELYRFCEGDGSRFQIFRPLPESSPPVGSVLNELTHLRKKVLQMSLRDSVGELLKGTNLKQRVASIGEKDFSEELLFAASEWEADKKTFYEWSRLVLQSLSDKADAGESGEDAIQLITSHKAKGLEWSVVILPFLYRDIGFKSEGYPRIFDFHGDCPRVLFHKADVTESESQYEKLRQDQSLERLAYVSLTRAKHSLILVDDFHCYDSAYLEKKSYQSFAACMKLPENRERIEKLPIGMPEPEEVPAEQASGFEEKFAARVNFLPDALRSSSQYIKRLLPHELVHSKDEAEAATIEEPVREELALSFPRRLAIDYGIWWHEFVEEIPWKEPVEKWDGLFESHHRYCSLPDRASGEWRLFRQSALCERLAGYDAEFHAEYPIFYVAGIDEVIEGVVDLLIKLEDSWILLDWKTDRIRPGELSVLAERYRPQLSAYKEAVTHVTGLNVTTLVYSTVLGEDVLVD